MLQDAVMDESASLSVYLNVHIKPIPGLVDWTSNLESVRTSEYDLRLGEHFKHVVGLEQKKRGVLAVEALPEDVIDACSSRAVSEVITKLKLPTKL